MPVIGDLGADHDELLARAGRIRALLAARQHADAAAVFDDLLGMLRRHTAVEEASVFAGLRTAGEMLDHVDALTADHAAVSDAVDQLDADNPAAWSAGVADLLGELRDHIAREEYDLFPAMLVAVGPADWDSIETAAEEAGTVAAERSATTLRVKTPQNRPTT